MVNGPSVTLWLLNKHYSNPIFLLNSGYGPSDGGKPTMMVGS